MSQLTSGIRCVLSNPHIYEISQNIMGAKKIRSELVREHIQPFPNCRILDIGCGPARILDELPDCQYFGFDLSRKYIDDAILRYGNRGKFHCSMVEKATIDHLGLFDIVIALGVLHHLDDFQSLDLLQLAISALRAGGKLITFDPVFVDRQNVVSRFLVSRDRGLNVRTAEKYYELANTVFFDVQTEVKHRVWIPYTHCIMKCIKKNDPF